MIQMPIDYGKYIYHFTRKEIACNLILKKNELKISSFLDSNDPKETKTFGCWSIFKNCNALEAIEITNAFKKYLSKYCKHLCFSSDYVLPINGTDFYISGYNHPYMWAHYANRSTGVCLVLDKEKFIKENSNLRPEKVEYVPVFNYPQIDPAIWKDRGDKYFKTFLTENKKKLFLQKHLHWECEHEIKTIEIGKKEFCNIEHSLQGVILGIDFDMKNIDDLKKVIAPNIWIEKIRLEEGRFVSSFFQS
jgi:hypothetical protein